MHSSAENTIEICTTEVVLMFVVVNQVSVYLINVLLHDAFVVICQALNCA